MTDAEVYECTKPPLMVDTLQKGKVYYVAVALKDADGYLSQWSQHLSIEKPIGTVLRQIVLACILKCFTLSSAPLSKGSN